MPQSTKRIALLLSALALSGCSFDAFTYTTSRYGTTQIRHVHLGCDDTYEVLDRPDAGTILVVTNALNESLAAMCQSGPEALPRPERMRRVARLFLAETSGRPECRIARETEITPLHTEFSYTCPPPSPSPSPRSPRGAGSPRRG